MLYESIQKPPFHHAYAQQHSQPGMQREASGIPPGLQREASGMVVSTAVAQMVNGAFTPDAAGVWCEETDALDTLVEEVVNKALTLDLGPDPEPVHGGRDSDAAAEDTPRVQGKILQDMSNEDLRNAAHFLKRVTSSLWNPVAFVGDKDMPPGDPSGMNISELFAAVDAVPGRYVSNIDAWYESEARLHKAGTVQHVNAGKEWQRKMAQMDTVKGRVTEFYNGVHAMLDTLPPYIIYILSHDRVTMGTAIKMVDEEMVARTKAVFGGA